MENINLKINLCTENISAEDYNRLRNLSYNGILIDAKSEDIIMLWDADYEIKEETFIVYGSVGNNGFGIGRLDIPIKNVNDAYNIYIEPLGENDAEEIKNILLKYNYTII